MAAALDHLPDHGLYTVAETAFVAELDSKAVNNEFEQDILESDAPDRLVPRPSLLYVAAIKSFRTQIATELRRLLHRGFVEAVANGDAVVELGCFRIPIDRIEADVAPRLALVDKLRDAIQVVPGVGGGEPVLTGTRIKPRLVAEMARAGTPKDELSAEYGISAEQVELALLFDALYPRRGRPPADRRNVKVHALPSR